MTTDKAKAAEINAEPIEGNVVPLSAEASTVALLNKSEIDMQIATAHKYPRTVKHFRDEVLALATLNEDVAAECSYALPRSDKTIIGPSARFAEIVCSAWGNCRAGARVVDERGGFVVAQGAFIDLQKNHAITYEVQRRITDKKGRRFNDDMIGVTANAACSIAIRNAILKGVPKALWFDLWERAREVAIGDATTLANRRANAIKKLAAYGVSEAQMLAKLGRVSLADVTPDDLGVILGILTRLKEGEITPEDAFADEGAPTGSSALDAINAAVSAPSGPTGISAAETAPPPPAPPKAQPPISEAYLLELVAKAQTANDFELVADLCRGVPNEESERVMAATDARLKDLAAQAAARKTPKQQTL
jgi:hypothetical protein